MRLGGDRVALDREQQDDREQQAVEGDRPDPRQELAVVPLAPLALQPDPPGQEPGGERDAEEDQDGARDLPDADLEAFVSSPSQPGSTVK